MYALQSPNPRPPARRSQTVPNPRPRQQRNPHRAIAMEVSVKLAVNVVLSTAAIAAVTQLLPHRTSQEVKLQELQVAVKSAGERLQKTQNSFSRYFDPYQTRAVMQEQTNRIEPNQRQIIWLEPKTNGNLNQQVSQPVGQPPLRGY